jgi:hypothetical protein
MAAASWVLCTASVIAAGRRTLALWLVVILPITGIVFSVIFLALRSEGTAGLIGLTLLLAAFDLATLRVVHQVWSDIEGGS